MGVQRVIIIGAGVAGPVLGRWLKQLGMKVVLAEARQAVALGEGAFLGVAPNGMNVLDALGIAESVASRGHACAAFRFSNRKGRQLGSIDRSQDQSQFRWPLTMIRRGELHALLANEAVRRGVDLRLGKRLVAIERSDSNAVSAKFDDGSEAVGDVLIGCDGLRSTVRSLVMPEAPPPTFSGLLDYGGFARVPNLPFPPNVNEMVFGRHAFFGAFTTPDGETWWFHNGPPPGGVSQRSPDGVSQRSPDGVSQRSPHAVSPRSTHGGPQRAPHRASQSAVREASSDESSPARVRDTLLALHRDDPPWISDLIRATPEILGPWPLYELGSIPRWSDKQVCLIGDAAHAMSPSSGQGASLAMEDAMLLAKCLRDIEPPSLAFQRFEQQRRHRVEEIFQQARRNSSGKAPPNQLAEWFRDRLLPVFLRLGAPAQSKPYGYRIDWELPVESAA